MKNNFNIHNYNYRDKEAADQVNLMRQLENALRTQQQLTTTKSEVLSKKIISVS